MAAIRTAVQGPFNCERLQLVLISGKLQVDTVKFLPPQNRENFDGCPWPPWWSTVSLKSKR